MTMNGEAARVAEEVPEGKERGRGRAGRFRNRVQFGVRGRPIARIRRRAHDRGVTEVATTIVRFRRGIDPVTDVPEVARANNLLNRTAVIQDTYRPDKVDMYFDEMLWRRVLDYACSFREGATIDINDVRLDPKPRGLLARLFQNEKWIECTESVESFLVRWNGTDPGEREPPPLIIVKDGHTPVLCVSTEYWSRVGGPPEYHDSYTYSIYASDDQSASIREFIEASNGAGHWDLREEV
jgi:hypothetical protein